MLFDNGIDWSYGELQVRCQKTILALSAWRQFFCFKRGSYMTPIYMEMHINVYQRISPFTTNERNWAASLGLINSKDTPTLNAPVLTFLQILSEFPSAHLIH